MTDLMTMLGSTFLVSSFVPALVFVSLNVLLLTLVFERCVNSLLVWPSGSFYLIPWIVLVVAIIVGYLLTSLDTQVINLYQGYPFLKVEPLVGWLQRKWYKRRQRIEDLLKEARETEDEDISEGRFMEYCEQLARFRRYYPRNECDVMPTRLGNILRASQSKCLHRYGIDQNAIWPLLYPAVSKEYRRLVESNNTLIQFLLNLSLLSLFFTGEVLLCLILGKLDHLSTEGMILLLFAPLLVGIGLYYLSIPVACTYGDYVFGCISLFRHHLLKELNMCLPTSLDKERDIWKSLNDFLSMGEGDPFGRFAYPPPSSSSAQVASDIETQ